MSPDLHSGGSDTRPGGILMLVPHEPHLDPRVLWSIDLCSSILPTHVLAVTSPDGTPRRELRGGATIEYLAPRSDGQAKNMPLAVAVEPAGKRIPWRRRLPVPAWVRRRRDALHHFTTASAYYSAFGDVLWRRASALADPPALIVCHDIYALRTALRLEQLWDARVLYDSHEFWPAADLLAEPWEVYLTTVYERRLIRQVDAVVTVSPPMARLLEKTYGLSHVISVPNACPTDSGVVPSSERAIGSPVRVLLQGQASPRRGFEELFEAWRLLDDARALLEVRCPPNAYLGELRRQYADLVGRGRLRFLEPVEEKDLVRAAAQSDVGVIPYPAGNLNHQYACPNKLAQYMHAGLAVLSNDLPYVRSVIEQYGCGTVFELARPESLVEVLRKLLAEPQLLQKMKEASARAAQTFNWEVQSQPYRAAVVELAGLAPAQLTV